MWSPMDTWARCLMYRRVKASTVCTQARVPMTPLRTSTTFQMEATKVLFHLSPTLKDKARPPRVEVEPTLPSEEEGCLSLSSDNNSD